ncbi:MAG: DUF1559 domain-containing protein [Aureliella sp.]
MTCNGGRHRAFTNGNQTAVSADLNRYPLNQMKHFGTRTLLIVTAIVAGICGIMIPAIQAARNAAMEMSCRNQVKQVGLALLNFESAYKRLPIAIERTDDGRLWRSWRSYVYPTFMEQRPLIYDASTAWDSTSNIRLIDGTPIPMPTGKAGGTTVLRSLDRVPWSFSCPSCKDQDGVNYVVVTGDGTAFQKTKPIKLADITDGLENTILVVESVTCTPDWTEPRDLDIETMDFKINSRDNPSISSFHPSGANVCFADMGVFLLTPNVTESELKAMLTISGGENVDRTDLLNRGVLIKR